MAGCTDRVARPASVRSTYRVPGKGPTNPVSPAPASQFWRRRQTLFDAIRCVFLPGKQGSVSRSCRSFLESSSGVGLVRVHLLCAGVAVLGF